MRIVAVVVAALSMSGPAAAQATAGESSSLARPAVVSRLKPMKWLYAIALRTGEGTPQRIGFRTLSLTDTTYEGTPAWLVIDSRQMHTALYAESLYVARADLRPLYRVQHTPDAQVVSRFSPDSIRTVFDGDSGRVAVAMASAPGALPTLYLVESLLAASSLGLHWSGTARMIAIDRTESGVVPLTLRTIREEKIDVPDGIFDTWVVSLSLGKSDETFWVRKSDGVVLRERLPVIGMPGASVDLLLGLNGVQTP